MYEHFHAHKPFLKNERFQSIADVPRLLEQCSDRRTDSFISRKLFVAACSCYMLIFTFKKKRTFEVKGGGSELPTESIFF